jgi:hypothetical protein
MTESGLGRSEWLEKLMQISQNLEQQGASAQLTLVGSAPGILAGQPARTSMDLDVWKSQSHYQYQALKGAVEAAGLLFDPKTTLEPDTPYLQLIEPGLVQTGKFDHTELLEQFGALRLERPPVANLMRADPKDLEDIAFILSRYQPSRQEIERAIWTMPSTARQKAASNLVYLDVMESVQP